jgi:hypothetical protein
VNLYKKCQNAKTAQQNAVMYLLFDFGAGKLERNLLYDKSNNNVSHLPFGSVRTSRNWKKIQKKGLIRFKTL